jgi:hypothetical protein
VLPEQSANRAADVRLWIARLGDGEVVFIQCHGIVAHAALRGGRVDDRQRTADAAALVIRLRLDSQPVGIVPIPVVKIGEVRVVRAKILDAHRRAEDRSKGVDQRRQHSSAMRRRQKENRPRVRRHLVHARSGGLVDGSSEDLLHEKAAEAVADKKDRPLPDSFLHHEVEHFERTRRESHALARVARAGTKPSFDAPPLRRAGRVLDGPDADVGKLAAEPVRPGSRFLLAVPPRAEGIAAEAVNEHDVGPTKGVVTAGDRVQATQRWAIPAD